MAKYEMESLTLGQICEAYGIDLKKILADLNSAAEDYPNKAKNKAKKR